MDVEFEVRSSTATDFQSENSDTAMIVSIDKLHSMFLLWSNSLWDFFSIGKLHRSVAACQRFVIVATSSADGCYWTWSRVILSVIVIVTLYTYKLLSKIFTNRPTLLIHPTCVAVQLWLNECYPFVLCM